MKKKKYKRSVSNCIFKTKRAEHTPQVVGKLIQQKYTHGEFVARDRTPNVLKY